MVHRFDQASGAFVPLRRTSVEFPSLRRRAAFQALTTPPAVRDALCRLVLLGMLPALQERDRLRGKKVGLILSGGNIDFSLFQRWVAPGADRSEL